MLQRKAGLNAYKLLGRTAYCVGQIPYSAVNLRTQLHQSCATQSFGSPTLCQLSSYLPDYLSRNKTRQGMRIALGVI